MGMHTAAEEKEAELKAMAAAKITDRRERVIWVIYQRLKIGLWF
jgi:hypothetical protein